MTEAIDILYCHCTNCQATPPRVKRAVLAGIVASGLRFEAVADLCELAARGDQTLRRLAQRPGVKIVACFPRAVRWLLDAAGAPLRSDAQIFNMRAQRADEILRQLGRRGAASKKKAEPLETLRARLEAPQPDRWIPWFPVIDRDRCGNCKQCLSFCLFGVYALNGSDAVEVRNPACCKTNCPACARVCPQAAIIFPKYGAAPINGGEAGDDQAQKVKIDPHTLAAGDVYEKLRARAAALRTPQDGVTE